MPLPPSPCTLCWVGCLSCGFPESSPHVGFLYRDRKGDKEVEGNTLVRYMPVRIITQRRRVSPSPSSSLLGCVFSLCLIFRSRAGPLWNSVAAFLGWNEERARELVEFGGVYYKPTSAPAMAKPKRELDPERQGAHACACAVAAAATPLFCTLCLFSCCCCACFFVWFQALLCVGSTVLCVISSLSCTVVLPPGKIW